MYLSWSLSPSRLRAVCVCLCSCAITMAAVEPSPMIGWRHDGSGVFPVDCKPVKEWDLGTNKNIVWRAPLPNHGNGSPIAVGKKVFVVVEPGFPLGNDAPLLQCFDGDTGTLLWQHAVDPFTKLPETERSQMTELRTLYWENLRKAHQLMHRFTQGDAAAGQELIKQFPQEKNEKFLNDIKSAAASGSGKGLQGIPLGHRKSELGKKMKPLREKHKFGIPAWNWTGMGIAMPTPVSDGKNVYVMHGWRTVAAYSLDGQEQWLTYLQDIKPRQYWVESCGNSPLLVDGKLVVCFFDHLLCFEPSTGKELWRVKTRTFEGHGMGTPAVLRLPLPGSTETITAIFCMGGELVRLSDGHVYADDIGMFDACVSTKSDGKDVIFATNGGSGGAWRGTKPAYAKRKFIDHKGGMAIRFILSDKDTVKAERLWTKDGGVGGIATIIDGKIYTSGAIIDAATGKQLASKDKKNYGMKFYHGQIYAGGLFIGNVNESPHPNPRKRKSEVAHFKTHVHAMGNFGRNSAQINVLNQVPDPSLGEEHKDCVISMTGSFTCRQWYGWHASYSTPFASGNRLFIRSYEYVYCIGDPSEAFVPSQAFLPR